VDLIEVDGSKGEGGGQILRTAVAFSVIGRVPVRVMKVRAGRDVPGLKRQHVSVIRLLAAVFGGGLSGDKEGSTEVEFTPGVQRLRSYHSDMGTAASITLVLQSVIPAVALGGSRISLDLVGGTDVPWSPTFDYFRSVVIPGYKAIGIDAEVASTRRGYYPKGGGRVTAEVRPCDSPVPLELVSPPEVSAPQIASRCGSLPVRVAERQAEAAAGALRLAGIRVGSVDVAEGESTSPGTSILISSLGVGHFIGADAIGARGRPAEDVGAEAADRFLSVVRSGGAMDSNLADMLLPFLSMARGESRVRVPEVTPHLESGLRIAEQFTSCSWRVHRDGAGAIVEILPRPA
jgi:RNA 3'-phosphate cyclase